MTSSVFDEDAAHRVVRDAGLVVRREVLGDEYVDAAISRNAGTDGEVLQGFVSEVAWGSVWTRPGLDRRARSLTTLGMLVALNQHNELATHTRAALRNGLTRDEIVEVVVHATAYAGVPAGVAAMRVVQETLTEVLGPRVAEPDEPEAAERAGTGAPLPHRRVGFIGLGAMGGPIATNFLGAGQPLVIHDADPDVQERFVGDHVNAVGATGLGAFAECDVVVLVLPNSDIVDKVVLGEAGLLQHLRPGAVIVDMGSSVPARTQNLAARAADRGVAVVDAPVSGGVARARAADLAIMAGGDRGVLESVRPLIDSTAREIIHVGAVGNGHAAKALNNLLAANGFVAAAEVLLVGRRFGIDPATLLSVLNASSGRNQATETKFEKFVLTRTFDSGFAATLMRKDVGIALDLAAGEDVTTTVGAAVGKVWNDAVDDLPAGADQTEILRYLEMITGVALDGELTVPAGH